MSECELVSQLVDAKQKIAAWRDEYNSERPHSSLGYRTPEQVCRNTEILSYVLADMLYVSGSWRRGHDRKKIIEAGQDSPVCCRCRCSRSPGRDPRSERRGQGVFRQRWGALERDARP